MGGSKITFLFDFDESEVSALIKSFNSFVGLLQARGKSHIAKTYLATVNARELRDSYDPKNFPGIPNLTLYHGHGRERGAVKHKKDKAVNMLLNFYLFLPIKLQMTYVIVLLIFLG